MRWYLNDVSLQGQYADVRGFESQIRSLLSARARIESLRTSFFTTRTLRERAATPTATVREVIQRTSDTDFRRVVLAWLDRNGPFLEDDRLPEPDDYFEHDGADVTETGLGEAARRVKAREPVATFSLLGGAKRFDTTPIVVDHGLEGDRLGSYPVANLWTIDQLAASAIDAGGPIASWKLLVESAQARFPRLLVPNNVYQNSLLAREPFDAAIRDRVLALLGHLDRYMSDRTANGAEGPTAQAVISDFFTGDRALFSAESPSNQREFRKELTFPDPVADGQFIFAHWHGKISHRVFRLHFEWPVPTGAARLKIVYLGPKLTKS
jgi:hypothetical protein